MTDQEQIKKEITDQLYWDARVDAADINVDVSGSEVTLKGKVPSFSAKQAAVNDAWNVYGVSKVNNEITVEFPPTFAIPTDEDIKSGVENLLKWNSFIDESDVISKVDAGAVELEGTVNSFWKKIRAEQLASDVIGVKEVHNKLSVVPTDDVLDKIVAENIVNAMDRNFLVDPEEVNVKVKKGKATLSGTVPNYTTYREAMSCAEHTTGVTEIQDNIRISYD
jgi:osmotically-inducible protein OsmY